MSQNSPSVINDLSLWDSLDSTRRVLVASAVGESLPVGFQLAGLEEHTLGGVTHEIAYFVYHGSKFALIPGVSEYPLGYDKEHPFALSKEQTDDFQRYTTPELLCSAEEWLGAILSPKRYVSVSPFLVDVDTYQAPYSAPAARASNGPTAGIEAIETGFRVPSVDEWEYICSAGTKTLFRWGNDSPLSCSYEEANWNLHKRRNAFGLQMNSDTYQIELCQFNNMRGGDGGLSVCGGFGNFYTWLPLASNFDMNERVIEFGCIDEVLVRRVYPLQNL